MKSIGIAVAAVLVFAGAWFVFVGTDDSRTVTADFAYVNGVFPGSKVAVLGVPVGTVESVEPQGVSVRVTMSVPTDVEIPADVNAYVMNPSVISDRFVELGPAYSGGDTLGDATIPIERSHSPINWDQLMGNVSTIASALGPDGGDVGSALDAVADAGAGIGPDINAAIRNIGQATAVIGGDSDDIGALIDNIDRLIGALAARDGAVVSVTESLAQLGTEISTQDLDIAAPIAGLRSLLDQLDSLLADRGDDLRAVLANAESVTAQFASHEAQFAEFMDLVPLMMQNIGNTIGDDQRARIRLNVSTDLDQFAIAVPLCRDLALPICTGAGLTNPISVPLSMSDPLGIAAVLGGGS